MQSGKPKKAPKVSKYDLDKNYMKEHDKNVKKKNPMSPMSKKRLSK